ncbi:hypothetical protein PLESTM_001445000 [Pleodorina starrii]|nr:hypothetical protein PLESTM_001445000 [Pleodorina starrii]
MPQVWLLLYPAHVISRRKKGEPPLERRRYIKVRLIMTAITIVFFTYPTVTNSLLGIFSCPLLDELPSEGTPYADQLQSVGRYWSKDYNLRCYTGPHRLLMLLLGVPGVLLFSVGVPGFSAWFLWYNRRRLRWRNFFRSYGFLYSDYEDRCYMWESVIMLRKLAVVTVVVFLGAISVQVQLLVSLGVMLLALAAQIWYDPYRCPRMDALERISLYGTTTLIYISLYFSLDLGDVVGLVLTALLVGLNGLVLCWFALIMLREVARLIMRNLDAGEDGVVTSADVMNSLEVLSLKRPWLAKCILRLDQWARRHARVARFLSYAYPYGEPTDPWVVAHTGLQPDFFDTTAPEPEPEPEQQDKDERKGQDGDGDGDGVRESDQDSDRGLEPVRPQAAPGQPGASAGVEGSQRSLPRMGSGSAAAPPLEPQLSITVVQSMPVAEAEAAGATAAGAAAAAGARPGSGGAAAPRRVSASVLGPTPRIISSGSGSSRGAGTGASPPTAATRNPPVLPTSEAPGPPSSASAGSAGGGGDNADGYSPCLPGTADVGQLPPTPCASATAIMPLIAAAAARPGSRLGTGTGTGTGSRPGSGSGSGSHPGAADSGRVPGRLEARGATRVCPQLPRESGSGRAGAAAAPTPDSDLAAELRSGLAAAAGVSSPSASSFALAARPPRSPRISLGAAREPSVRGGVAAGDPGGSAGSGGGGGAFGSRPSSAAAAAPQVTGRRSLSAWEAKEGPEAAPDVAGSDGL